MSRKCSWCGIRWPASDVFTRCPQCQERTELIRKEPTIDYADAVRAKTEMDFGWWLLVNDRL